MAEEAKPDKAGPGYRPGRHRPPPPSARREGGLASPPPRRERGSGYRPLPQQEAGHLFGFLEISSLTS